MNRKINGNSFENTIKFWDESLKQGLVDLLKIQPLTETIIKLKEHIALCSHVLLYILFLIENENILEKKDGKMDKQIKKIKKEVKKEEKQLDRLEKADKKRDKFVTAGKKAMKMKGKC